MIPKENEVLEELEFIMLPSNTYRLNIEDNFINGYCDQLEAMKQAIYKILNTERYEDLIYSWNYGIELVDLYGQPTGYVCSEVQRRISEALLVDERIESVKDFVFNTPKKGVVEVSFKVNTIFGEIEGERMVNY